MVNAINIPITPLQDNLKRMCKNSQKAIKEHKDQLRYIEIFRRDKGGAYASIEESISRIEEIQLVKFQKPISVVSSTCTYEGRFNKPNEDRFLMEEFEDAVLAGVFDGHKSRKSNLQGGHLAAEYAADFFKNNFSANLKLNKGDILKAFEHTFDMIQEELEKKEELHTVGTTAVVSYIDKKSHLIYTATIGDSEANIYREIDGSFKSIPLSCIRDWSSVKDAKRASIALNKPEIALEWPQLERAKILRCPEDGLNISRSLGDFDFKKYLIHKPKITVQELKGKDIVVVASDGLKDILTENQIVERIKMFKSNYFKEKESLAGQLIRYAADSMAADNVTVVGLEIN